MNNNRNKMKDTELENGNCKQSATSKDTRRTNKSNKRNNKRSKQFGSTSAKENSNIKPTNDPNWYGLGTSLINNVTNLNFTHVAGEIMTDLYPKHVGLTQVKPVETSIPGIMVYDLLPSVGITNNPNDPLNVASNQVYSFVRHANSGSKNYEHCDLMMYILAVSQCYSLLNYIQRGYRIAYTYAAGNRFYPRGILAALGYNPDSFMGSIPQLRAALNLAISKLSTLYVPATFSWFYRSGYVYSNIYTDGDVVTSQLYGARPLNFWEYNTITGELALTWQQNSAGVVTRTWDSLINTLNGMIDRIVYDEACNIMSGDILKAYGIDGIMKLVPVGDIEFITPVYDPAMLSQFKNADNLGWTSPANYVNNDGHSAVWNYDDGMVSEIFATWTVTQVADQNINSQLRFAPQYTCSPGVAAGTFEEGEWLASLYSEDAPMVLYTDALADDSAMVLESTRWKTILALSDNRQKATVVSTGAEVVTGVHMYALTSAPNAFNSIAQYDLPAISNDVGKILETVDMVVNFAAAPRALLFTKYPDNSIQLYDLINYNNWTIESRHTLKQINDAVMMAMFRVPTPGLSEANKLS